MSGNRLGPAAHSPAANKSIEQKTLIKPRNITEEYTERSPKKELNGRVRNRKEQKRSWTEKCRDRKMEPETMEPKDLLDNGPASRYFCLTSFCPPAMLALEFCWLVPNNRA